MPSLPAAPLNPQEDADQFTDADYQKFFEDCRREDQDEAEAVEAEVNRRHYLEHLPTEAEGNSSREAPKDRYTAESEDEPTLPPIGSFGETSSRELNAKSQWEVDLAVARERIKRVGLLQLDPYSAELARVEARSRVRRDMQAEASAGLPDYVFGTLAEMQKLPPLSAHRIEDLMVFEGTTTVVAPRKAGKSTFVGGVTRCLTTGEPFLGRFNVLPIETDNRVGILNFEVSAQQHTQWLSDMGIDPDRVFTAHLRGYANPFRDATATRLLAKRLRDARVESLIVDPFANAFTGDDPNSDASVTPFLNMLQEFARSDVGVKDLILVVHAGWAEGRSRGSSRLEDWPDAIWNIRRDATTGKRYFKADGRDVSLEEHGLSFDPVTRLLTLDGVSTTESNAALNLAQLRPKISAYLAAHPGSSANGIKSGVEGKESTIGQALNALVASGEVSAEKRHGKGGGMAYSLSAPTVV